jgi:serine protease AprX
MKSKAPKHRKKKPMRANPRFARTWIADSLAFAPGIETYVKGDKNLERQWKTLGKAVSVTVAPKTRSGQPIQSARGLLRGANLDDYRPHDDAVVATEDRLKKLGFEIVKIGRFGITARANVQLLNDVLKTRLTVFARPRNDTPRSTRSLSRDLTAPTPSDLFVAPPESLALSTGISDDIDHFVFIPPPLFFSPVNAEPLKPGYHHLQRADIRRLLNVPDNFDGEGIKLALIDTGFFPHPFYSKEGYSFKAVSTSTAPDAATDKVGHGTAVALNVFAVAPKAEVLGFKQSNPPQDALEDAADAAALVISCSW